MILFFDTETTGFAHKSKPIDHPDQPHVVQLAAALTEDDGKVVSGFNFIIDPGVCNGVRIPSAVAAIHGIDEEKAWRFGRHPIDVLTMFDALYPHADTIVGHNVDFDIEMMLISFGRHKADWQWNAGPIADKFCTMRESTDICKLPSPRGGYKWPKLGEAYLHFFGRELVGAHDAMVDLDACKQIYFALKSGAPAAKGGEW